MTDKEFLFQIMADRMDMLYLRNRPEAETAKNDYVKQKEKIEMILAGLSDGDASLIREHIQMLESDNSAEGNFFYEHGFKDGLRLAFLFEDFKKNGGTSWN